MIDTRKPEEIALSRHKAISPLLEALDDGADGAKIVQLRKDICLKNGISRRTLGRWLTGYSERGFEGLKPASRIPSKPGIIPESVIEEAIFLRRELPSRSIPQIIEILEMEGKAPAGSVKRTTLQERLAERGYSARQMKLYSQSGVAARRFARIDRNDLWQSDIKFGPFITVNGEKRQIYLVCFIDDATRYVVAAEFYDSQDQAVVEDCFRKAILKAGLPRRVYFDNGKQFNNHWMRRACATLEITLLFAKPYSPESKGKVERFNRTIDSFLDEVSLKHCRTLEDYNKYLAVWLQECYHSREHSSLKTTPEAAYKSSKAALRFAPADVVAKAFKRAELRKVDKSGCISFRGKKYEVGVAFVGQNVTVAYDHTDIRTLEVEPKYGEPFAIKELTIGIHTGPRPKLPKTIGRVNPETSRLLDAKEKQYKSRMDAAKRAIRYGEFAGDEDGEADV